MERYHPKFIGFETALKALRKKSSDSVQSTARIPLPFAVQTHIERKFNLGWRETNTRVVYVELKAYDEQYAVPEEENSFEMF